MVGASGWSIVVTTPLLATKPWLVVPAADGGASAEAFDTASAASMAAEKATTSKRVRVFVGEVMSAPLCTGTNSFSSRVFAPSSKQFEASITS